MRRQRVQSNNAQRYGLMGTGAIATLLSLYHFLSQVSGTPVPATNNYANSPFANNAGNYTAPFNGNPASTGQAAQIAKEAFGNLANYASHIPSPQSQNGTAAYSGALNTITGALQTIAPVATGDVQAFVYRATGSEQAVASEIAHAQRQVLVQAYSIYSPTIVKALVDARHRGVDVIVVLDASQQTDTNSAASYLSNANIRTVLNSDRTVPHTKVILIDGHTIISGGFDNGDRTSDEHVFVTRNRSDIYANFDASFMASYQRSQPFSAQSYPGRTTGYTPDNGKTKFSTASVPTSGYSTSPIQPGNLSNAPLSTRQWQNQFSRPSSSFPTSR